MPTYEDLPSDIILPPFTVDFGANTFVCVNYSGDVNVNRTEVRGLNNELGGKRVTSDPKAYRFTCQRGPTTVTLPAISDAVVCAALGITAPSNYKITSLPTDSGSDGQQATFDVIAELEINA